MRQRKTWGKLTSGEDAIAAAQRSFAQPPRAFTARQRDAQRRAKRGAEAPGQRTARGRLLRRVGQPFARLRCTEPVRFEQLAENTRRRTPGIAASLIPRYSFTDARCCEQFLENLIVRVQE